MAGNSRAIKAGAAFVEMLLDDEQFTQQMEEWEVKLGQIGRKYQSLGTAVAAIGSAIMAPFVLGVRNMVTYNAQIALAADRTGFARQEFANLAAMSEITGTSVETLEIALKSMGERLVQLQTGSLEFRRNFEAMNIDIQEFSSANQMQRLEMMNKAFNNLTDAGMASGRALALLGEGGHQLQLLLRLSPAEFRAFAEFADSLSPDEDELSRSLRLFFAWKTFLISFRSMTSALGAALEPFLTPLLDTARDLMVGIADFAREHPNMARMVFAFGAFLVFLGAIPTLAKTVLFLFGQIRLGVALLGTGLMKLATILATVSNFLWRFIILAGNWPLMVAAALVAARKTNVDPFYEAIFGTDSPEQLLIAQLMKLQLIYEQWVNKIDKIINPMREEGEDSPFQMWKIEKLQKMIDSLGGNEPGWVNNFVNKWLFGAERMEQAAAGLAGPPTGFQYAGFQSAFFNQRSAGFAAISDVADPQMKIAENTEVSAKKTTELVDIIKAGTGVAGGLSF